MTRARTAKIGAVLATATLLTAPVAKATQPQIGPSFRCPVPSDPLGQLVCKLPSLARADLALVQAFQALRMQVPERRKELTDEAAAFSHALRTSCKILDGALPPVSAVNCIAKAYATKRAKWVAPLTGAAAQEANRSLEQQIALQADLLSIGLLTGDTRTDGVYTGPTRAAIAAFQQTEGLTPTGLLDDQTAAMLADQALKHAGTAQAPTTAPAGVPATAKTPSTAEKPADHAGWRTLLASLSESGLSVSVDLASTCLVRVEVRDPQKLATAAQHAQRDDTDDATPFATEIDFLDGPVAAEVVHFFYRDQGAEPDRCRFSFSAFTRNIYGQDIDKPLFTFDFDRALNDKVVWDRIDPHNMPRISLNFAEDPDTEKHLPASVATKQTTVAHVSQPDTPRTATTKIAAWTGTSTLTTRPFHADGPWELQWQSGGSFLAILHRTNSDKADIVADANESATSSAYQAAGGDFYLQITATDPWRASVVAVQPP